MKRLILIILLFPLSLNAQSMKGFRLGTKSTPLKMHTTYAGYSGILIVNTYNDKIYRVGITVGPINLIDVRDLIDLVNTKYNINLTIDTEVSLNHKVLLYDNKANTNYTMVVDDSSGDQDIYVNFAILHRDVFKKIIQLKRQKTLSDM